MQSKLQGHCLRIFYTWHFFINTPGLLSLLSPFPYTSEYLLCVSSHCIALATLSQLTWVSTCRFGVLGCEPAFWCILKRSLWCLKKKKKYSLIHWKKVREKTEKLEVPKLRLLLQDTRGRLVQASWSSWATLHGNTAAEHSLKQEWIWFLPSPLLLSLFLQQNAWNGACENSAVCA